MSTMSLRAAKGTHERRSTNGQDEQKILTEESSSAPSIGNRGLKEALNLRGVEQGLVQHGEAVVVPLQEGVRNVGGRGGLLTIPSARGSGQ